MNEHDLKHYLLKVAKRGYADKENERKWAKQPDFSTTIRHTDGPWSMDDNFFGGEPYGGREVYPCLQDALADPDEELPVRGPRTFEQGSMRYEASWDGELGGFSGRERIFDGSQEIYTVSFVGGLVDVRGEIASGGEVG